VGFLDASEKWPQENAGNGNSSVGNAGHILFEVPEMVMVVADCNLNYDRIEASAESRMYSTTRIRIHFYGMYICQKQIAVASTV
jgi:hypothetical protein